MGANTGQKVAAPGPKPGGGLFWGPLGTALPTDETTALATAFKCLGAVSSSGIKPSRSASTAKPTEWGGETLAQLESEKSLGIEFLLLSVLDSDALGFAFGAANVTTTAATATAGTKQAILDKAYTIPPGILVADMTFAGKLIRKIYPYLYPTITGEEPYVTNGLTGYTITGEAIKDSTGVRMYEYSQDNNKTA